MKKISWVFAGLVAATLSSAANAQTLNWAALQENQKHVIHANVGWDYSASFGVGYSYKLNTKTPVVLNSQFSIPSGQNLLDDFKTKLGLQVRLFKSGNFMGSVGAHGIFRRYQSDLARVSNFGSEFTGTVGIYKPRWFAAAEIGFDKAIATKLTATDLMKQYYPDFSDGWYVPTGGNFLFGIQAGYSLKTVDMYMKVGRVLDQNFKQSVQVPNYAQLGVNVRF